MNRIVVYFVLFFISSSGLANDYISPFNSLEIKKDTTKYHFFVSGHFYGSDKNQSGLPANTILGNLDWINQQEPYMFIHLGDLFKDVNTNIPNYERTLFSKLKSPLVNTVGNHDISGTTYQDNYGETDFSFEVANDLHIILDTEKNNGDLSNEQLGLIKSAQRAGLAYDNIFIYTHRTIWKDGYSDLNGLFSDNTQSITGNNFSSEVKPLIEDLAKNSNLYWMSGSMGTAPASFFHYENSGVTFIATAIRELPRDAILEVIVDGSNTSFQTHSLTRQELSSLETYNVEFWQSNLGVEPYNYKLIPYYFEVMLTHRFFWYGVLWTFFGVTVIYLFVRRKKRKSKIKPSA
ncbi:MAG: metallophosphoesterase family protein [Crocinitomicaceae bacterium]